MSTHNFKVHDTNKANIWSDADYNNLPERTSGYVATNVIKSKDFNTFMREASLQAVALSDLLVDSDDGSAATLGIESDAQDVKAAYLRGFNNNVETHLGNSQTISEINQDISEINQRLDELGFKEGSWSASETLTINTLRKQGKFAISTIRVGLLSINPGGFLSITFQLPADFKPKSVTRLIFTYQYNYDDQISYEGFDEISLFSDGKMTFNIRNTSADTMYVYNLGITNAGWEIA